MRSIAGFLIDHPEKRASGSTVERMLKAMAGHAIISEHSKILSQGSFGSSSSNLKDQNTRSIRACLEADPEWCVIADARLEHTHKLAHHLELECSEALNTSDSTLIRRAYSKWGTECPLYLEGAFAFCIWDPHQKILFAARDRFGVKPLVYHNHPGCFVVASQAKGILASGLVPKKINSNRIADFLSPWLEGIDFSSTFFEGIHRLPPAHSLIYCPDNRDLKTHRYWQLNAPSSLHLASDSDYENQFTQILRQAITNPVSNLETTASMLSGGLDSSSVVALLSEHMAEKNDSPLTTFSAISEDRIACKESSSAKSVARRWNCQGNWIKPDQYAKDCLSFRESAALCDNPFEHNLLIAKAVFSEAKKQDFQTVLSGMGGDNICDISNRYLVYLYKNWDFTNIVSAVQKETHISMHWRAALRWAGACALPGLLPETAWLAIRSRLKKNKIQNYLNYSPISPEFAQKINLEDRLSTLYDLELPSIEPAGITERQLQILNWPCQTAALERYDSIARYSGVEIVHPHFNLELINFLLSIPWNQRRRNGWSKWIVRKAMLKHLPSETNWRTDWDSLPFAFSAATVDKELQNASSSTWKATLSNLDGLVKPTVIDAAKNQLSNKCRSRGSLGPSLANILFLANWIEHHGSM